MATAALLKIFETL